jgi:hypothetical protein
MGVAEDEAEHEGGEQPFAFHPDLPRAGPRRGDYVEQDKPNGKEYDGDPVVGVAAEVAHDAACCGGDGANGGDGHQNPDGEEHRHKECSPGRGAALLVNEPDDERDAGKVAGAKQNAEHAPKERGAERDERCALDGVRQFCEEPLHQVGHP